jgi:hypothetical protein
MPRSGWTPKDERKYQHIKESSEERGKDEDTAEEIAARTVNKQRRLQGRTRNRRTEGTGNPNVPLAKRSKDELVNLAKAKHLHVTTRSTKAQLMKQLEGK